MQVDTWGPPLWSFLHTMTFNAPDKIIAVDGAPYKRFFSSLGDLLPCRFCRDSYKVFIEYVPLCRYLGTRMGLTYWLYTIHDLVNRKLGKRSPTFLEVVERYEKNRSGGTSLDMSAFARSAEQRYGARAKRQIQRLLKSKKIEMQR